MACVTLLDSPGRGTLEAHFGYEDRATGLLRRRLYIYRPKTRRKRLPLMLVLDGQNAFAGSAPADSWQMEVAVDQADDPWLVVGVANSSHRYREYIGWSKKEGHTDEAAQRHCALLTEVILPYIRSQHKITRVCLLGASAGGVAALYTAWENPGVFDTVGCMSAGRHYFLELLRRYREPPPFRLYLSCGNRGMDKGFVAPNRNFAKKLRRRGAEVLLREHLGDHSEKTWSRRIPDFLRFCSHSRQS